MLEAHVTWQEEREDGGERQARSVSLREKRAARGWTFVVVSLVVALVLAVLPVPYVIEQPGPVFDTLGSTSRQGQELPMISIEGAPTYPTTGSLDMLTVSVVGTPAQRPSWAEIVGAWFDPSRAVLPIESVYPGSTTAQQRAQQDQQQMVSSQQVAIAAALTELGYGVSQSITVASVGTEVPASGLLQPGDVITAVNGQSVRTVQSLREAVTVNGADKPAQVTVARDGRDRTVSITPVTGPDGPVFGISLSVAYDFPIDVTIQLDNVGGPSAGMMFALGIVDTLTPGDLGGGAEVAGTGTISADGRVGAIGGIRQKMYGAVGAGADYFLAPVGNCGDVRGHIPDGLRAFAVGTLDDALAVLDALRSNSGLESLPTCDTVSAAP